MCEEVVKTNNYDDSEDWSHVKETVMMLNLATSQIEKAMKDGDESVTALGETFISLVGKAESIDKSANSLPDSDDKENIILNCKEISEKMSAAIVTFQFYDKLVQRVSHIRNSLSSMGELISDPKRLHEPGKWIDLQEEIKSKYTVETDKAMFDAVMNGATLEEALSLADKLEAEEDNSEIELF